MANDDLVWKVIPHDPIERLSENLWWVSGTLPRMTLRRNMTVARLADGRLLLHNPIALEESAMHELEAWGEIAFLVVPNAFHRMDTPRYKARYPKAIVIAPRGARAKVAEKVAVDRTYADAGIDDDTVTFRHLDGVANREGVLTMRSADGTTVVLNDAVFNMEKKRDFLGWLFTTTMGSAPGPRISRLVKLALIKDKAAFKRDLERLAETPHLVRFIVAHELVAKGKDAAEALRRAASHV